MSKDYATIALVKKITAILTKVWQFVKARKFLVGGILIAAVAAYLIFGGKKNGAETYVVERGNLTDMVSASGEIVARQQVTLNFPVSGKLGYIRVKNGDQVGAWQALMGLDTTDLRAAVINAEYAYRAADANAKEVEDDVKGHDDDENFDERNRRVAAQTARDIAWENWQVASWNLRNASLVSPFAGIVTNITTTTVGDTVSPSDGVTIFNPDTLYFKADVDEIDYGKIEQGQEVEISLDAFPERTFIGHVILINRGGVETAGGALNIIVEIELDPFEETLVTGLNGDAQFFIAEKENVLMIPKKYLTIEDGKNMVSVKKGRKVTDQEVELGMTTTNSVEITSGLSEGEILVLKSS